MNLCNDEHEEICFEGRDCPMCAMKENYESQIDDLLKELKETENG